MHFTNSLSVFSWKFNDLCCNIDLRVCVCVGVRLCVCLYVVCVLWCYVCMPVICCYVSVCSLDWFVVTLDREINSIYQQITRSLWEQSRSKVGGSILIISSQAELDVLVKLGQALDSYTVPIFNVKLSVSVSVKDALKVVLFNSWKMCLIWPPWWSVMHACVHSWPWIPHGQWWHVLTNE